MKSFFNSFNIDFPWTTFWFCKNYCWLKRKCPRQFFRYRTRVISSRAMLEKTRCENHVTRPSISTRCNSPPIGGSQKKKKFVYASNTYRAAKINCIKKYNNILSTLRAESLTVSRKYLEHRLWSIRRGRTVLNPKRNTTSRVLGINRNTKVFPLKRGAVPSCTHNEIQCRLLDKRIQWNATSSHMHK